jgi:phosphatidylglycerol:prolipoprotein diacylglycerol transferase
MKPIPVAFHIGPLELHTYGIGLAITFWFAYRYFERRLGREGFRTDWVATMFLWVIVSAIVGARVLHVASNWTSGPDYEHNLGQIFSIWQGGLSSFGGIIFAVPTGLYIARKKCPELTTSRALDIVAPVLMAAWAMGRLLGPQLMESGGGHQTTQWFGMYYAGQPGRRLPVPIFQAIGDFAVFVILLQIEKRLNRWPDGSRRRGYPTGVVLGVAMTLWGIERFFDEKLFLGETGRVGSDLVQGAGIALAVGGLVVLFIARRRWASWLAGGAPGGHDEVEPTPAEPLGTTPSEPASPLAGA